MFLTGSEFSKYRRRRASVSMISRRGGNGDDARRRRSRRSRDSPRDAHTGPVVSNRRSLRAVTFSQRLHSVYLCIPHARAVYIRSVAHYACTRCTGTTPRSQLRRESDQIARYTDENSTCERTSPKCWEPRRFGRRRAFVAARALP